MKKTPPLSLYKKIATVFIAVTIVLVAAIFYFSLTFAFIEVTPRVTVKEFPVSILITEKREAVDPYKGVYEGTILSQSYDKTSTFQATGVKAVKSNSTGKVVVINNNTKAQPLVATTRLLAPDGTLFRLKNGVTVPAGGRIDAEAYQDDPTKGASVQVGDKLSVPGLSEALQQVIYAEVATDFSGEEREVKVVSKEDLDKATQEILMQMESEFRSLAGEEKRLVLKANVLEKTFSVLAGVEAENFEASVKANLEGVAFRENSATDYLVKMVEGVIGLDQEISNGKSITVDYEIESIESAVRSAQLNGIVKAPLVVRQNSSILDPKKLVKLNAQEVEGYLENSPDIESVEVKFFPFWVRKVPSFADHVIISIKDEGLTEQSQ